jgi:hypothetical protein
MFKLKWKLFTFSSICRFIQDSVHSNLQCTSLWTRWPSVPRMLRSVSVVEAECAVILIRRSLPEAGYRGRGRIGRPSAFQKSGRARQGVTESAHSPLPKTAELRERCRSVGGERERESESEMWASLETNLGMAAPPSWMQSSKLASGFISILMVLV